MQSLGDLGVNWLLHIFDRPIVHIRLIFLIMATFYASTVSTIVFAGHEEPLSAEMDPTLEHRRAQSTNIIAYLRGLPSWMWRIGATYAFGCFMMFCTLPNSSSWLGSTVLGGKISCNPEIREGQNLEELVFTLTLDI